MASSTPTTEIMNAFGGAKLEADAVAECQSICQTFDLTVKELFLRWQQFLLNRHGGNASIQPTRDMLLQVRSMLQQELERKSTNRQNGNYSQSTQSTNKLTRNKDRMHHHHYDKDSVEGLLQGMVSGSQREPPNTPQSVKRVGLLKRNGPASAGPNSGNSMFSPLTPSVFAEPSPSAIRYSQRNNMGRAEDSIHSDLPTWTHPDGDARKQVVVRDLYVKAAEDPNHVHSDDDDDDDDDDEEKKEKEENEQSNRRMRYMFEKIGARTEAINKRIERIAVDTKAKYNIEALANPTYAHQELVTAVGRIVNINLDESYGTSLGKISGDTLYLETSRRLGGGRRVQLDVKGTPSFSLFPGQIVAVEGKNLKGSEFSVSQFRPLPLLQQLRMGEREEENCRPVLPFSAIVASGPFTLADNFEYEPLADLVTHAIGAAPCVVFLLGPFVNEHHPMLADGQIDMLPEEIFVTKISPHLTRLRKGLPSTSSIYLVPSPDELCSPYTSFPQPAFSREQLHELGVPSGIDSLSNPAQVLVNGMNICLSNVDVLFHMVKEEVSRLPAVSDRLPRLAWHVVEQRHLYPLSPPPMECASILASQDTRLRLQCMPDILIIPSQLKQFVRTQDGVILLNPGYSSKGLAGGTYAKIYVHSKESVDQSTDNSMLAMPGQELPSDFTSVEIVRV